MYLLLPRYPLGWLSYQRTEEKTSLDILWFWQDCTGCLSSYYPLGSFKIKYLIFIIISFLIWRLGWVIFFQFLLLPLWGQEPFGLVTIQFYSFLLSNNLWFSLAASSFDFISRIFFLLLLRINRCESFLSFFFFPETWILSFYPLCHI